MGEEWVAGHMEAVEGGAGTDTNGVLLLLDVGAASAPGPFLSIPVPAIGGSSVTHYNDLAGTAGPLIPSAPTPSTLLCLPCAVGEVLHANSTLGATDLHHFPDRRDPTGRS